MPCCCVLYYAVLGCCLLTGWPLSELWHREIASALGLESILAEADKAPSVLNGGLSNIWVAAAGAVSLVVGGLLELRTQAMVRLYSLIHSVTFSPIQSLTRFTNARTFYFILLEN